ncbi:MAG: hypothetical protein WDO73_26125 [Ignavibacteriota bacterium]
MTDPTEKENQGENPQFLTIKNELSGLLDKWKTDYSTTTPAAPATPASKGKKKKGK